MKQIGWHSGYVFMEIRENGKMAYFFLEDARGEIFYLFRERCFKPVRNYFLRPRKLQEIYSFNMWRKNRRLSKTIEKLPMYIGFLRHNEVKPSFAA